MAWETRERGGSYYTRSRREEGRVVREYVGTGEVAELIAHADETRRLERAERVEAERAELERARGLVDMVPDLDAAVEILVRAEMIAAGYHLHKGEWRRRRIC